MRQRRLPFLFFIFLSLLFVVVINRKQICSKVEAFCGRSQLQNASSEQLAPHYIVYSPTSLHSAQQHGKTVLYFWASWCSSCTSLDLDIQSKKELVPEGVTILRVDYDHSQELKQKYTIVTQHSFVQIDADGKALSSWIGGDMSTLFEHLK